MRVCVPKGNTSPKTKCLSNAFFLPTMAGGVTGFEENVYMFQSSCSGKGRVGVKAVVGEGKN